MTVRDPAVAGRFYPARPDEVAAEVASLYRRAGASAITPEPALGVMCPHAGWMYSGRLAAQTLASVVVPERVVILCPNHTGRGARIAVMAEGAWRLPGATVPIDAPLAAAILAEARAIGARADESAHTHEHAIEVLVPLLLARQPALRIVPIVVGGLDGDGCVALGEALARALPPDCLVVASSDMSHYLTEVEARARDRRALDALVTGDPHVLYDTVEDNDISMCGVRPATALLAFARERGAAPPRLVGYTTSAEASGDRARVVGYAGAIV